MGRQILLLGIGQSGCTVAELFSNKLNKDGSVVHAFSVDTDERTLSKTSSSSVISMTNEGSLYSVVEELGAEKISSWFPCDWENDHSDFIKNLDMKTGSNLWRMKAFLSFAAYLSNKKNVERLHNELKSIVKSCKDDDEIELHTVASLAGGTGSGLFLPFVLYIKKYIKSIGGRISSSSAILVMPGVYENCFSAEQRVKSFSNAYSAMRELNAVDRTVSFEPSENENNSYIPIDFKIGEKKGIPELLFDSEKEEYRTMEASPFNRVILFDRVPDVNSVQAHMSIINDILISICFHGDSPEKKTLKSKKTGIVYEGISISKVKYPIGSIVKYITTKQLHNFIMKEFCSLTDMVNTITRNESNLSYRYSKKISDDTLFTAKLITSYIEDDMSPNKILKRRDDSDDNNDIYRNLWNSDYNEIISKYVCDSFEFDSIKELLAETTRTLIPADQKSNIFTVKKERKMLADLAKKCKDLLNDFYVRSIKSLTEGSQEFEDSILNKDNKDISIITNLIMENGKYIHPTFALIRLGLLYQELSGYIPSDLDFDIDYAPKSHIPAKLLIVDYTKKKKTRYSRLGDKRFFELLMETVPFVEEEEDNEQNKPLNDSDLRNETDASAAVVYAERIADDEDLFRYDLETVCKKLQTIFRACRYKAVLDIVGRLIKKYLSVADSIYRYENDVALEIKRCSVLDSTNGGNLVNVGVDPANKESMYNEYIDSYFKEKEKSIDIDGAVGELIASVALDSESEISGIDLSEKIRRIYEDHMMTTDFYKSSIDRDVLSASVDSVNNRFGRSDCTYSKIFLEKYIPIRVRRYGEAALVRSVGNYCLAILPCELRDNMLENPHSYDNCSPEEYINRIMYDAGEYNATSTFAEKVDRHQMFIRREISGFPLYFVESLNELSDDCIAYKSYLKSRRLAKDQLTYMWNSGLGIKRTVSTRIPYISPEAQHGYELSVVKAVLYALIVEDIFVNDLEDVGDVYYLRGENGRIPVLFEDKPVLKKQIKKLMLWAYADEEWTTLYSERFDQEFLGKKRITINEFSNHEDIIAKIINSGRVTRLKYGLSTLFLQLYDSKALDNFALSYRIAELLDQIISDYSLNGALEHDEYTVHIYNVLNRSFADDFIDRFGKPKGKTFIKWLNSNGYFKLLSYHGESKDHEI